LKDEEDEEEPRLLYGLATLEGKALTPPLFTSADLNGAGLGLMPAIRDKKLVYVTINGEIVWEERPSLLTEVDVDFMVRGYCTASSSMDRKTRKRWRKLNGFGGWGTSGNEAKPIAKTLGFPRHALTLVARPADTARFGRTYPGFHLYLANTTRKTIDFTAQDSRLNINMQALDRDGQWKDIEYLPSSWCGNSYHKVALRSAQYWQFTLPQYHGGFKTRLRAALRYSLPGKDEAEPTQVFMYSNEFEGSVNPGQFWRKEGYTPSGIMDPYNE
jgi:hypothetical protein